MALSNSQPPAKPLLMQFPKLAKYCGTSKGNHGFFDLNLHLYLNATPSVEPAGWLLL